MKEWTKPQNVIALIVALTSLLAAWTEHRRASRAEAKVETKQERIDQLDDYLMEQRSELFE